MTGLTKLLPALFLTACFLSAQQTPPAATDAASAPATEPATTSTYTPPTHGEKFRTYLSHTYGLGSILEAGVRAGIDQGLERPNQWQEGATGYAERFGSAMGVQAVRGTTTYGFEEVFNEDLRYVHCRPNCTISKRFKVAFENTFEARKASDGHEAFSAARLIGPIAAGLVASEWRPNGFRRGEVAREIGFTYGLGFMRNLIRGLAKH